MAPKPAPLALKVVRGDRSSRVNLSEPPAPIPAEVPEPPDDFSPYAQDVWRRHAADLHRIGLFTVRDPEAFGVWCQAVAFEREAARELEAGLVIEGRQNGIVRNPAWQMWRDAAMVVLRAGSEFGMTPSSRQGIVMNPPAEDEKTRLLS